MILLLEIIDVLLRDLHITFQLKNVDKVLTLIGQLLLEIVDLLHCAWVLKLIQDVKEHGVLVRLFHDLSHLVVEIVQETPGWVINNVQKRLKTNTTLADVTVEKSDTDYDIAQLAELGDFFWSGQGYEWSKSSSWKN